MCKKWAVWVHSVASKSCRSFPSLGPAVPLPVLTARLAANRDFMMFVDYAAVSVSEARLYRPGAQPALRGCRRVAHRATAGSCTPNISCFKTARARFARGTRFLSDSFWWQMRPGQINSAFLMTA